MLSKTKIQFKHKFYIKAFSIRHSTEDDVDDKWFVEGTDNEAGTCYGNIVRAT